jgi:hypothetical protein
MDCMAIPGNHLDMQLSSCKILKSLCKSAPMRTLFLLTLLAGFVAAVVLPHNEVGTHGLPACGDKTVTKAQGCPAEPPTKGDPVAWHAPVAICAGATFAGCETAVWRSVRTAANAQLNLPLLI